MCTKPGYLNAWDPLKTPSQRSFLLGLQAGIQDKLFQKTSGPFSFANVWHYLGQKTGPTAFHPRRSSRGSPRANFVHVLYSFAASLSTTAGRSAHTGLARKLWTFMATTPSFALLAVLAHFDMTT